MKKSVSKNDREHLEGKFSYSYFFRIVSSAWMLFVGVFTFSSLLLIAYLPQQPFIDEIDNMLGGFVVSQGGLLYRDFLSQHTPFMYYLFSVFSHLGAYDIISFRLMFYITIALGIALTAVKFRNSFPKWVFFLWPALYITSFTLNPDLSYTSLATHLVALVVCYLLLELLSTAREVEMGLRSWTVIGALSMISIFSSFISIYPVFLLSLAILLSQISLGKNRRGTSRQTLFSSLGRQITMAGAGYLIPMGALLLIPVFTGTFSEFLFQAFFLNTEIYSKYLGLGQDAFGAFWAGGAHFQNIFSYIFLKDVNPIIGFRNLLNPVAIYALIAITIRQRRPWVAILILLTAFALSIRGTSGFHSQQIWAFGSLATALVLGYMARHTQVHQAFERIWRVGTAVVTALIVILSTVTYAQMIPPAYAAVAKYLSSPSPEYGKQAYIDAVLGENESFFQTGLDPYSYLLSKRVPVAGIYGYVPWFEDALGPEIRGSLYTGEPKLIFHNPDNSVWGYVLRDFDSEMSRYIEKHYTRISPMPLEGNDYAWVRNDILNLAIGNLALQDPATWCSGTMVPINSASQIAPIGEIQSGNIVEQNFLTGGQLLTGVGLRFGTYARPNDSEIEVSLSLSSTGQTLRTVVLDTKGLQDNAIWAWVFDPLPGYEDEELVLSLQVLSGTPGSSVTLYKTLSDSYSGGALTLNGYGSGEDLELYQYIYEESVAQIPACVSLQ